MKSYLTLTVLVTVFEFPALSNTVTEMVLMPNELVSTEIVPLDGSTPEVESVAVHVALVT